MTTTAVMVNEAAAAAAAGDRRFGQYRVRHGNQRLPSSVLYSVLSKTPRVPDRITATLLPT